MANNTLLVKTVKGMERSHMRLVLTKTLVRGGLALVNEHQFHLQIVMIRKPFQADFAFALIQKNWSYALRKWWESLVTILEHWRLEGVVDHVAN